MSDLAALLMAELEPRRTNEQQAAARDFFSGLVGAVKTASPKKPWEKVPKLRPPTIQAKDLPTGIKARVDPAAARNVRIADTGTTGATTRPAPPPKVRGQVVKLPQDKRRRSAAVAVTKGPMPIRARIKFQKKPSWSRSGVRRLLAARRGKTKRAGATTALEKNAFLATAIDDLLRAGGAAAKARGGEAAAAAAGAKAAPAKGWGGSLRDNIFGPKQTSRKSAWHERWMERTPTQTVAARQRVPGDRTSPLRHFTDPATRAKAAELTAAQKGAATKVNEDLAKMRWDSGATYKDFDELTRARRAGKVTEAEWGAWNKKMQAAHATPVAEMKAWEGGRAARATSGVDAAAADVGRAFATPEGTFTRDSVMAGIKDKGYLDPDKLISGAIGAWGAHKASRAAQEAALAETRRKLMIGAAGLGGGAIALKAMTGGRPNQPRHLPPPGQGYT
jgi:hypothetical protein